MSIYEESVQVLEYFLSGFVIDRENQQFRRNYSVLNKELQLKIADSLQNYYYYFFPELLKQTLLQN